MTPPPRPIAMHVISKGSGIYFRLAHLPLGGAFQDRRDLVIFDNSQARRANSCVGTFAEGWPNRPPLNRMGQ